MDMIGKVMKSTGSWYRLELGQDVVDARLRGRFKTEGLKVTNPIAVGDHVRVTHQEGELTYVIEEILPRENYIIRTSPKKRGFYHMIASNINLAVLIITVDYPKTSRGFIDRFLVSAEAFRIPSLLVFNKQDLMTEKHREVQDNFVREYQQIGYPTLFTSAESKHGIEVLKDRLKNQISLLSGHSGSGKSTLLNILVPDAGQETSEVSKSVNKGKHTTTFAEMFRMEDQTYLIDTPGIKELGIAEIETEELSHYFPEMRKLLGECRFHNCMHVNEPGCAVIESVMDGEMPESRYESYLSMLENQDNRR